MPWLPSDDEKTDYLESANNTPQLIRHGGTRWSFPLVIVPVNMVTDAATAAEIDVFMDSNYVFDVPMLNFPASSNSGTWTVNGAHSVGDTTVNCNAGTGSLTPGQFLTFGTKKKVYRVRSYTAGVITLTKPLRQALADTDAIVYTGTDGKSNAFDGVLGEFINKDFGQGANYRIDNELVAHFGPFRLVESLA